MITDKLQLVEQTGKTTSLAIDNLGCYGHFNARTSHTL